MADSGDALDQAQTVLNAQKAASLAAIAQAGSQGAAAYQQALQSNAADKATALKGLLAQAAPWAVPQQFTAQQTAGLSQPFDSAATNLRQQDTARQTFIGNLGAQTGSYMDEASAAVPAMRAAAHNALLNANEKLSAAAAAQNQALQLKNLDLQIAQANLAKAQGSGTTGSVTDALKSLGTTAGEQGANLFGMGQDQNAVDQAAQAQALQGTTFDPTGSVLGAITSAYPTVNTTNPGGVNGYNLSAGGATPVNITPTATQASAAAQDLNRRLAELGAGGATGFLPNVTPTAAGTFGGIPAISPSLADQLYGQSEQGRADQTAVDAAQKAAAAIPAAPTPAQLRVTPNYQQASGEFAAGLAQIKAGKAPKGATIQTVVSALQQPHKLGGNGPMIQYDLPTLLQVIEDQRAINGGAANAGF